MNTLRNIEQVLQDIDVVDFGQEITCEANVPIWRPRGKYRPVIGEFVYRFRFRT